MPRAASCGRALRERIGWRGRFPRTVGGFGVSKFKQVQWPSWVGLRQHPGFQENQAQTNHRRHDDHRQDPTSEIQAKPRPFETRMVTFQNSRLWTIGVGGFNCVRFAIIQPAIARRLPETVDRTIHDHTAFCYFA